MKIYSPITGKIKQLKELNDGMFSEGFLGEGIAISSDSEKQFVCAPMSGEIVSIFPTNHAFIVGNDKYQVLVHIGIDTVDLKGKCFRRVVEIGTHVEIGDPIIETDFAMIEDSRLKNVVILLSPENTITFISNSKDVVVAKDVVLEI